MFTKIKHRDEIDGLRAVAVMSVVFYHLQFNSFNTFIFSGGFLGVDIFFVISGYLITKILLENIDKKKFYFTFLNKRFRRLFPLIIFIFIIFIPIAYFTLLPVDLLDFSKSILSALGLFSNIYFYSTQVEYGIENLTKPMLHLWSLSVEKQYYILFPLVLIFFKRIRNKAFFLSSAIFVNLFLIQFLGNFNFSEPFIEKTFIFEAKTVFFNFFFLTSRIWEFLLGFLAVLLERKIIIKSTIFKLIITYFGLVIIFFSIFYYNDRIFHPSIINFIPAFGTFLVILFFTKSNKFCFLSSLPIVFIGKISYSIYLWHYPLICFSYYLELDFTSYKFIVLYIPILFLLSSLSFYLIERKFRDERISNKKFYLYFSVIIVAIFFVLLSFIKTNGADYRVPEIFTKKIEDKTSLYNHKFYKNLNSSKNVILVGDSHMKSLKFNLKQNLKELNINYAQSIFDGCQLIRNTQRVDKITLKPKLNCTITTQKKRMNFLNKHSNSIIIIGGRLPLILSEERFNNQEGGIEGSMDDFIQNEQKSLNSKEKRNQLIFTEYKNTVLELANKNILIVIYPIPEVGWNVPRKLKKNLGLNLYGIDIEKIEKKLRENPITTKSDLYHDRTLSSFKLLDSIKHKNIIRVYPHRIFCNNYFSKKCATHDTKNVYYYDDNHLSIQGSEMLNKVILNEIRKVFAHE